MTDPDLPSQINSAKGADARQACDAPSHSQQGERGDASPTTPDPKLIEVAWLIVRERCCADPEKATRAVMVGKADIAAALSPIIEERDRLKEEIEEYLGHRTDNVAGKFWAARMMLSRFEDALEEMVGEFDRISTDDYDQSLELHGCGEDMRLNAEQQKFIRDAGFAQVWLNHGEKKANCWETHYRLTGDLPARGWRKRYVPDPASSYDRVIVGDPEPGYWEVSYLPEGWNPDHHRVVPDPLENLP